MNRILIFSCLFALSIFSSFAQINKNAGVCFRVDDDQDTTKLREFAAIFKKHGVNFTYGPNVQKALRSRGPLFWPTLNNVLADGNELADHSPNHYAQYFEVTRLADVAEYNNKPGVDHIGYKDTNSYSGPKICLKYTLLNTSGSGDEGRVDLIGNMLISRNPGEFASNRIYGSKYYSYFYIPSLGLVLSYTNFNNANPNDVDTAFVKSFWIESNSYTNATNLQFVKLTNYDISIDKSGFELMAQHTLKVLKQNNVNYVPTTWIQPGGAIPYLDKSYVKDALKDKFNYQSAATYPGILKCYNEHNPQLDNAFGMQWGDFYDENQSVSAIKAIISDRHARNYVTFNLNHFSSYGNNFDWATIKQNVENIIIWCKANNIPIKTYAQWANELYHTQSKVTQNIMPAIQNDFDGDGKADGYNTANNTLDKTTGVPQSNNYCFSVTGNNQLFSVQRLAGIEKGANKFSLYTKGGNNDKLLVVIDMPEVSQTLYLNNISANTGTFTKYEFDFFVPKNVSYINIYGNAQNSSGQKIYVSGLEIKGVNKPKIQQTEIKRKANEPFKPINLNNITVDEAYAATSLNWLVLQNGNFINATVDGSSMKLNFINPNNIFWTGTDSIRLVAVNPAGAADTSTIIIKSETVKVCKGEPILCWFEPHANYKSFSWSATVNDPNMKVDSNGYLAVKPIFGNTYKLLLTYQDNSTKEHFIVVSLNQTREVNQNDTLLPTNNPANKNIDLKLPFGFTASIYNNPKSAFYIENGRLKLPTQNPLVNDSVTIYIHTTTCDVIKRNYIFNSGVGLGSIKNNNFNLSVYPNPVNQVLSIGSNASALNNLQLTVINLVGKQVYKTVLNDNLYTLDLSFLDKGIYFLKFENTSGEHTTIKIIKD